MPTESDTTNPDYDELNASPDAGQMPQGDEDFDARGQETQADPRAQIDEATRRMRETANDLTSKARRAIIDRPLTAVAVVFGASFVLGRLMR